ncbi:MAG: hypothetical protein QMD01_07850 [Thermodesulfovibrionales bacterium]|nr:hypothetical protein [Thermodesulfovibrionales bacterium]
MVRKITAMVAAIVMVFAFASVSFAGWDKCKGCHTDANKPAPGKAALLKKFKAAVDFKKVAKDSKNPMMNAFKGDADLDAAAKELGLK